MAWSLKIILKWLWSKMDSLDEWKKVIVFIVSKVFQVSADLVAKVWDAVVDLVLAAAGKFPGSGTGDAKYAYVWERLKAVASELKPLARDILIHWALLALGKLGRKT